MSGFFDFLRMVMGWWSSAGAAELPATHVITFSGQLSGPVTFTGRLSDAIEFAGAPADAIEFTGNI